MDVLLISPGYPVEMAEFARGLASVGVRVIGLGDQPADALPEVARGALTHHIHVEPLTDETAVLRAVHQLAPQAEIGQVECLWEPYMYLAARLRESLGLPGMTVEQTVPFRDKEQMKRRLDAAGIRTPWHETTSTAAGVRDIAERIGYPIIVKPIAGAGSADTYRVDAVEQLDDVLALLHHVPEVSVEEFVDGEEFTYDTICAGGEILHDSIAWYRPRPLQMRQHEWISPVSVVLRDIAVPFVAGGREMGARVIEALGFRDGFTHMEWYRTPDGEVVFGEIGARPPGARVVDLMNYACDSDFFVGWAEAVVHGRLTQPTTRRYNAASIFKRAKGQGHITAIEGLSGLLDEYGDHVVAVDLADVGSPRSDWTQSVIADGRVVVRHHDLHTTLEMADRFAAELHLHAG
jgi:formate-dependent phosphoribosylglycinamide formyltransferase (GAR transformylase)